MRKLDKAWLGAIIGAIIPILILIAVYFEENIEGSFFSFLNDMFANRLLSVFLQIGLIGNLAIFLLSFHTGLNRLPKGILGSTIGYGLFIAYMYIW